MVWTMKGTMKGPKGDDGDPGAPGEDISLQVTSTHIQWRLGTGTWTNLIALADLAGEDGAGIAIAGSVATYAALPTGLTAGDAGDGYLVQADGKLYIWDGSAFPADGAGIEFRGPQGLPGDDGAPGADGADGLSVELRVNAGNIEWRQAGGSWGTLVSLATITGPQGAPGADGADGTNGSDGADGLRGTQWFSGEGTPGTVAGSATGDFYLDTVSGTIYVLE